MASSNNSDDVPKPKFVIKLGDQDTTPLENTEDFLRLFVEYNTGTEVPPMFALWAGLGAISCALGRSTWIDMGSFVLYPNLYICLVAGSGRHRKTTAIDQAERVIRGLEPTPNLIAQKITPEGLVKAIRDKQQADPLKPLAVPTGDCVGFVLAGELMDFLNKASYEAGLGSMLCPFFDGKDEWVYETRGRGKEKLSNLCLGILGAATVDWIKSGIPAEAVGGGLSSRFIFVYVNDPVKPVPLPKFGEEKKLILEKLRKILGRISTYQGVYKLDKEAEAMYCEEYIDFVENSKFYLDRSLSGYASRRMSHLLRVSMLLSASHGPTKLITEHDISCAKALLLQVEEALPMLMNLITSTDQGELNTYVLSIISRINKISRKELLRLVSHKVSAHQLDEVLLTLQAGEQINVENENGKMFYSFTGRK